MTTQEQIKKYIEEQPASKKNDMQVLHRMIRKIMPRGKLWYLDGRDSLGKVVTTPNIGYGFQTMKYADGKTRDFYQVGFTANTGGISIYIIGLKDKKYLSKTFGKNLGKASVTGYCIKFKSLKDINIDILEAAIRGALKFQNN